MSKSPVMLQPKELTKVKNYEHNPWSFEDGSLIHPGAYPGRYASTEELEEQEVPKGFWRALDRTNEDINNAQRSKNKVYERFKELDARVEAHGFKGMPEFKDYNGDEIMKLLEKAGGIIRNLVGMGLGSLTDCEEQDFEDNVRAHFFLRTLFYTLSKREHEKARRNNLADPQGFKIYYEDSRYVDKDREYIKGYTLHQIYTDNKRIEIIPECNGRSFRGTHGSNGDYIFITFKPDDPFRQILAAYTYNKGSSEKLWTEEADPIMPRAIICRRAFEEFGEDKTDQRVADWFSRYSVVHQFTEEDNKMFGGAMFLHILKPESQDNSPAALGIQGSA